MMSHDLFYSPIYNEIMDTFVRPNVPPRQPPPKSVPKPHFSKEQTELIEETLKCSPGELSQDELKKVFAELSEQCSQATMMEHGKADLARNIRQVAEQFTKMQSDILLSSILETPVPNQNDTKRKKNKKNHAQNKRNHSRNRRN